MNIRMYDVCCIKVGKYETENIIQKIFIKDLPGYSSLADVYISDDILPFKSIIDF